MIENRFTLEMQYWKNLPNGREIVDNLTGEKGISIDELCRIASELYCNCEELKSVNEVYENSLNKLEEENKELQQFKQLVFDLIDRKINEMEKEYKFGQEVYKGCPMHNIRYGINTLKELRKELSE